jgi:hypothetical protein
MCNIEHLKCSDHNADGDPCAATPVRGVWKCGTHGGRALSEATGLANVDVEELVDTYARIGPALQAARVTTREKTYVESIQDGLDRANAMVSLLEMLVATLRPKAKAYVETIGEGPREREVWRQTQEGLVGPDVDGNLATHPWVILLKEWTQHQVNFAKTAADLGIQERTVRVQEAQLQVMSQAMIGFVEHLGLDLHSPEVQRAMEASLTAIDANVVDISSTEV